MNYTQQSAMKSLNTAIRTYHAPPAFCLEVMHDCNFGKEGAREEVFATAG
jgi:hypothetical protein